jgi:alpha-1,3/alpha-1,6-mannosyltransferase
VFTSHHDPKHCFEETKDGTLDVRVHGDFLPRDIMGRFYIICAMLRQLVITLWILKNERDTFDVLFIDQLSACIPILKWFTSAKVMGGKDLKPKVKHVL